MSLNVQDLLVLHENVNRQVGDERGNSFYFYKNNVNILESLNKLVDEQILIRNTSPEVTLNKLNKNSLKTILKNGNLTVGGNKKELINRILNNIEYIDKTFLELSPVYKTTNKGEDLLKTTEYVVHFGRGYNHISLPLAHEIVTNYINDDKQDKVIAVYKYEIEKIYQSTPLDSKLKDLYTYLAEYFWKDKKDNDRARKYYNLAYYLQIQNLLDKLREPYSLYYDAYGKFNEKQLENDLTPYYFNQAIYEQLILVDNLSNKDMYEMFVKDITQYYKLDENIFKYAIDYLVAYIKNEDMEDTFTEALSLIKNKYLIPKKERDRFDYSLDEDDYVSDGLHKNRQTLKTNINTLIKENINIEIEIDLNTGEMIFFLEESEIENIKKIYNSDKF